MKVYTVKYNANQPSDKQINIPNYSVANIGVSVEKDGQIVELSGSQINLVDGNTVISSDGNYNGYATFPITTGNENEDKNFTLSCNKDYIINYSNDYQLSSKGNKPAMMPAEISVSNDFLSQISGIPISPKDFTIVVDTPDGQTNKYSMIQLGNIDSKKTIWGSNAAGQWYNNRVTPTVFKWTLTYPDDFDLDFQSVKFNWKSPYKCFANAKLIVRQGEEFKSNFNLRVNSDKSSVLDSNEIKESEVRDIMANDTIQISGTYTDSTSFNYTIPVIR